jgi:hypothetical protein
MHNFAFIFQVTRPDGKQEDIAGLVFPGELTPHIPSPGESISFDHEHGAFCGDVKARAVTYRSGDGASCNRTEIRILLENLQKRE